tara:strand:+ start:1183 stop:2541 length:1359 start_codon:yes stop_codon:yes gene_type:complete
MNLSQFLTKLQKELEGYSEFREELDRQPQTFVFSKRTLLTETIKQLDKGHGIKFTNKEKTDIKTIVDAAGDELVKELKRIHPGLKSPGGKSTLVFEKNTNVAIPSYLEEKGIPVTHFTNFRKVKFAYRTAMNDMFKNLQNYIKSTGRDSIKTKTGKEKASIMHFFDAGHEENAGVFERFLDTKTNSIMKELNSKITQDSEIERKKLIKTLKKFGINISTDKVDKKDTIIIKIESASKNRSRGQKSGLRSRKLQQKIKKFLQNSKFEDVTASDSIKEQNIKKLKNVAIQPFLNKTNIKVSKGKEIVKETKVKRTKKVKSKIKSTALLLNERVRVKGRKRKEKATSSTSELLRMIAMINKRLPDVVRKNMQEPALQNRTGRFADSVEVTEIVPTPKGFPSVGYTYRKNPYQVFEMGQGEPPWATPERDPRKLIDRSIREVAAQLAMGRLFTRRV